MGTIVNMLLAKSYKYWSEELNWPILHWKRVFILKEISLSWDVRRQMKYTEQKPQLNLLCLKWNHWPSPPSWQYMSQNFQVLPPRVIHKNIGIPKLGVGAEKSLHYKWVYQKKRKWWSPKIGWTFTILIICFNLICLLHSVARNLQQPECAMSKRCMWSTEQPRLIKI